MEEGGYICHAIMHWCAGTSEGTQKVSSLIHCSVSGALEYTIFQPMLKQVLLALYLCRYSSNTISAAALLYLPQHPMKQHAQHSCATKDFFLDLQLNFGNPLVPAGLTQSGNPAAMVGKDLLVFEILIYGICFANEGNLFSVFSGIHGGSSSAMGS